MYFWGYFLYSIGVKKRAKNIFIKLDDGSDWKLKLLLARINISMDEFNKALKYLDEVMTLVSDSKIKRILLEDKISILFKLEKYNAALSILEKEDQDDVNILEMIANIYLKKDDLDLAESYAKKINTIDPVNETAIFLLVGINYKRKKYNETIKYCNKLLKYDKETALRLLANSYLEFNDLVMAEKYFKKLRSKYSGQLATIFTHARLEYKKGNIKKAYKILKFIEDQGIECNEDFYGIYNQVKKEIEK